MSQKKVDFTVTDGVAQITFVNPAGNNAMDMQFLQEFTAAAISCSTDPELKAILITGQGESFSVGGDIKHFVTHRDDLRREIFDMAHVIHTGIVALSRATAPVLIAVNGTAAGGGFSLVCTADMVIAKRSAKLVSAYTRSGLTPDAGGSFYLPRIVGFRKAFEIMALNPTLSADEACKLGIVQRVVDDDKFDDEVKALTRQLAGMPHGTLGALKSLFRNSFSATLHEQLDMESEMISIHASSPQTLKMLDKFLTKSK